MRVTFDDLNQKMCTFALARLEAMGPSHGGLENYYTHLARRGSMLREEERAIAEYIDRDIKPANILELCAGAAQLGHLLSLMGHRVTAVEIDKPRHAFAVALGEHLGSTCEVLLSPWQKLNLPAWRLLVTLNAASSHVFPSDTKWLVDYARGGGQFIIRPRQFGPGIDVMIPGLRATQIHKDVYHYAAL